jgi:hypothetical protein
MISNIIQPKIREDIEQQRYDLVDTVRFEDKIRFTFARDETQFEQTAVHVNCLDVSENTVTLCEGYGMASEYAVRGFECTVPTISRGLSKIHTRYYGTIEELHKLADKEKRSVSYYF